MLLTFPVRFLTMPALVARSGCVARVYCDANHARFSCLVFNETAQLGKCPVAHEPTHFFVQAGSFSDTFQVFQRKCLLRCFGVFNQFLANAMVLVTDKPLLAFRRFLQAPFRRFSAALLKPSAMFPQLLPKCLDFLTRVAFAFTGGYDVHNPEVATDNPALAIGRRFFYVASRQKKKLAFKKAQVTFPLARFEKPALMFTTNEGNFDTAHRCPNRNLALVKLISQNPVVVRNGAKGFESALDLWIQLVGIGHFGDTTDNDLRGQTELRPRAFISDFVKGELTESLIVPSQTRQKIASGVSDLQSLFQRFGLLLCGLELELGNQLHSFKYSRKYAVAATPQVELRSTLLFLHPDKQGGFQGASL